MTFGTLDYAPMFEDSSRPPAMVTLTYPRDWLAVAPNGRAAKRHFDNWCRRYTKAWGDLPMIWKLEFQDRGAPHFAFMMAPPHGKRTCRCRLCGRPGEPLAFRDWLSHSWADTVGAADPERYADHVKAGTGIDFAEGMRASDPHRLAVYFSKASGAAGGKEYQHIVPAEWQGPGDGPGRFWGYRGLEPALASVDVTPADFVAMKRALSRLSRYQTFYRPGARAPHRVERRTRVVWVDRVNTRTGVIRRRRVTRPYRYLSGSSGGGFVNCNNGPALIEALARYQEVRNG
jgi:hypothetical protein